MDLYSAVFHIRHYSNLDLIIRNLSDRILNLVWDWCAVVGIGFRGSCRKIKLFGSEALNQNQTPLLLATLSQNFTSPIDRAPFETYVYQVLGTFTMQFLWFFKALKPVWPPGFGEIFRKNQCYFWTYYKSNICKIFSESWICNSFLAMTHSSRVIAEKP